MDTLVDEYPSLIGKSDLFRKGTQLANGYWHETNFSAKTIHTYCRQIIYSLGLGDEDWEVVLKD
jgi:hypothetical protein